MLSSEMPHEVEPVAGEAWRFHVRSRRGDQPPHLVDLSEYDGNGKCNCDHFAFRFSPALERGINDDWLRCYHILRARGFVLNTIIAASKVELPLGAMLARVIQCWFEIETAKIADKKNETE
jgi:hypothetical protein